MPENLGEDRQEHNCQKYQGHGVWPDIGALANRRTLLSLLSRREEWSVPEIVLTRGVQMEPISLVPWGYS